MRERASDIHLVPFEETIQLRYRIDGLLQEKPPPPKRLHAALVSRIKIMADMNIAERYMPQDGHIQINHRGARVDIRVGTLPTIYGEGMVLRLLEKNSKLLTPQELGLDPERGPSCCRRLVGKPHGLFLDHRSDRQRQNHHALFHSPRHLHAREKDPHDRRPGRIRAARRGANSGAAKPELHLCQRACARSCARTRTSSWSAKSATRKRRKSPSERR